jgi:hypothetical protein
VQQVIDIDAAITVLNKQLAAIGKIQDTILKKKSPTLMDVSRLNSMAMTMSRGLAALLAEMRKTDAEVDEVLKQMTPDRAAMLMLKMIKRSSPEHRAGAARLIADLDGKIIGHGGEP